MADVFRTLCIAAEDADLARIIAATLDPAGSTGMFETPVGPAPDPEAEAPPAPTYFVSSGYIGQGWEYIAPCTTWELVDGVWVVTSTYPGDPAAVVAQCAAAGLILTLAQVEGVFSRADVSDQDPLVAFERLGVVLYGAEVAA